MKKNRILEFKKLGFVLLVPLVIGLCGCGKDEVSKDAENVSEQIEESEAAIDEATDIEENVDSAEDAVSYPKIVYIENNTYYGTEEKCEMVPRKAPDGIIETFVPEEIMPDAFNSANFGSEYGTLEYMFLEDDQLIVHIGEVWYYFVASETDDGEILL